MRTVVGYTESGEKRWSESTPATPLTHASRGGSLVVGESQRDRELRLQRASMRRKREARRSGGMRRVEWNRHDALTSRCRHAGCVWIRVQEARRLFATTNLSLEQIGMMLGGRVRSTVVYWINEYQDPAA